MFWIRFARPLRVQELAASVGSSVTIQGRIVAERTLSIAGSQARPVWFDMTLETYQTGNRGRGRPMWIPSKAEEQMAPFALDDGTGKIWILAESGGVEVSGAHREVGQVGKRATRRFIARMLIPGDEVRVRGNLGESRRGDPEGILLRGTVDRPIQILVRRRMATIPREG